VLYLVDPVDELLAQALPEYAGKCVRSLGKGALDWERASDDAAADPAQADEFAELTKHLEELLSTHVKRVRLSMRLTASPACLVGEEYDYTPRMERLLLKGKGGGPRQRRILELNPKHPVITKLRERQRTAADDARWPDDAELLLTHALLAEGSEPANPVRFTRALVDLMERSF
jgi:molecular chaperone HtpG